MRIRRATGEEMLRLWGYEGLKDASPTARFFHENLSSGNARFWTVDNEGELIGELYAFLKLDDEDFADGKDNAYLCAFRIKDGYRRQGTGTRLMKTVLEDLKSAGFKKATIGVSPDEEMNIRLYQRLGFRAKIKYCHYDPCSRDGNDQPEYDEKGYWLLVRDLI